MDEAPKAHNLFSDQDVIVSTVPVNLDQIKRTIGLAPAGSFKKSRSMLEIEELRTEVPSKWWAATTDADGECWIEVDLGDVYRIVKIQCRIHELCCRKILVQTRLTTDQKYESVKTVMAEEGACKIRVFAEGRFFRLAMGRPIQIGAAFALSDLDIRGYIAPIYPPLREEPSVSPPFTQAKR